MAERIDELRDLCENLRAMAPDRTADPVRIAGALGVRVRFFDLGEVKGFYTVVNGVPFIALNRQLPEEVRNIVCAHELGHHLLHRDIAEKTVFNDYDLYRMETKFEREANLFASFLLITGEDLLALQEPALSGRSVPELAAALGTTAELLAIRLRAEGLPLDVRVSRFPA